MKLPKLLLPLVTAIEFTDLTALLFLVHAVFSAIIFLILDSSPYINATSLGLILVMDVVFFMALKKSTEVNAAHITILAWYVLLFFNVRLVALLLLPPEALEFPVGMIGDYLTDENISDGLWFIVGGIIAIILGIFSAGDLGRRFQSKAVFSGGQFSLLALTMYWIITYIVAYYVTVHLGLTNFGSPEKWGHRSAWVRVIFDTDVALMWTFVWMLIQYHYFNFTKNQKLYISLLILIWLTFSMVAGSRGGPLRILIFLMFATLIIKPKFKLSILRFVAIISIFYIINSLVFSFGTAFRYSGILGDDVMTSLSYYQDKEGAGYWKKFKTSDQKNISELRRAFYESNAVLKLSLTVRPIVTRLGTLDYPITIVSGDPDPESIDHYIKSYHALKNFVNNLVPGEIFDEATVSTSRVFRLLYREETLEDISQGFMSEPYTAWGMAWLLIGYFGILLLFIAALCIQIGLNLLKNKISLFSCGLRFVYMLTVILMFYGMFGIDHLLTFITHFSVASVIAYFFMIALSRKQAIKKS